MSSSRTFRQISSRAPGLSPRDIGVVGRMSFVQAAAEVLEPIPDASIDVGHERSVLIYVDDKVAAARSNGC